MKVRAPELIARLGRDFLLQAGYISAAVLVGVIAVFLLLENVLTRQALIGEAEFYWNNPAENRQTLPTTRNMRAYHSLLSAEIPLALRELTTGFHDGPEDGSTTYVSDHEGERLYLVFSQQQVGRLIIVFGLAPLIFVLIVLYIALYVAYRVSRRAMSPIVSLATQVRELDPAAPDADLFTTGDSPNDEVRVLSSAMQDLANRLTAFAERERNFTRDASHELRSPLTVIRMATRQLENAQLNTSADVALQRITKAARDMEELTDAFLLLAREPDGLEWQEPISVNEIVQDEVDKARLLVGSKPVSIEFEQRAQLVTLAPAQVIASVVGNLLRNGLNYTEEGQVSVAVSDAAVTVTDTGSGMSPEEAAQVFEPYYRARHDARGHGVGMTIVKRLCDRFNWEISVDSKPDYGTQVAVKIKK